MDVSKNRVENPPKWMVKIMENPIKMDDLGGTIIFGNTHIGEAFLITTQGYPAYIGEGWRHPRCPTQNAPLVHQHMIRPADYAPASQRESWQECQVPWFLSVGWLVNVDGVYYPGHPQPMLTFNNLSQPRN